MNPLQISCSHFAPAAGLGSTQSARCLSVLTERKQGCHENFSVLCNLYLPKKRLLPLAARSYYKEHIEELEKVQERVTSRVKGLDGLEPCGEVKKIRLELIRRKEIKRGHDSNVKF